MQFDQQTSPAANVLFDPYNVRIGGVKADPYRIAREYGLGGAEAQALKKLLRMGTKHKSRTQDAQEVISTMKRVIEMDAEDSRSSFQETKNITKSK